MDRLERSASPVPPKYDFSTFIFYCSIPLLSAFTKRFCHEFRHSIRIFECCASLFIGKPGMYLSVSQAFWPPALSTSPVSHLSSLPFPAYILINQFADGLAVIGLFGCALVVCRTTTCGFPGCTSPSAALNRISML
jgi:hypothetical protein